MEDESNPWPSFVDTFSTVLCYFYISYVGVCT